MAIHRRRAQRGGPEMSNNDRDVCRHYHLFESALTSASSLVFRPVHSVCRRTKRIWRSRRGKTRTATMCPKEFLWDRLIPFFFLPGPPACSCMTSAYHLEGLAGTFITIIRQLSLSLAGGALAKTEIPKTSESRKIT